MAAKLIHTIDGKEFYINDTQITARKEQMIGEVAVYTYNLSNGNIIGSTEKIDIAESGGGSGSGSVTKVETGTGLTGGPITTTGTISIDSAKFATVNGSDVYIPGATSKQNIVIRTYNKFPDSFVNDKSLQELVNSIKTYTYAAAGTAYLGMIYGDCVPGGASQAECKVEYMQDRTIGSQVVAVLTVSSGDTPPYFWMLNTYETPCKWHSWELRE